MKGVIPFLLAALLCFLPCDARTMDDDALFGHTEGIWAIEGKGTLERWVVIHNLSEAKDTGIFHLEVIGHEKERPVWDIRRVCNHMAITKEALKRSVTKPLNKGAVYPEAFDDAYARWKKDADEGRLVVCESSILECLPVESPQEGQ